MKYGMKYGVYKFAGTKGMIYLDGSLDADEVAKMGGFVKIAETYTRDEATKIVYKLYKRDKRAKRKAHQ